MTTRALGTLGSTEDVKTQLGYVVSYLNGDDRHQHATLAGRRRIADLVHDLQRASNLDPSDLDDLFEDVRKRLGRYPNPWSLGVDDYLFSSGSRYEGTAAAELIELGGAVRLIRLCICGKWFAARSYNQECCSAKCRQRKYERTDKAKEKARRRGQRCYWLGKLREARGLGNKQLAIEIETKLANIEREGDGHGSL